MLLAQHGILPSMSRQGNCWDNAVIERFFKSYKDEWIGDSVHHTRDAAIHDNSILSLLAMIVATHADTFIGTLCSSFTAIIQRRRGITRGDRRFLFASNDFGKYVRFQHCQFEETRSGRFSWNRAPLPIGSRHHAWCREWPEVFEGIEIPQGRVDGI